MPRIFRTSMYFLHASSSSESMSRITPSTEYDISTGYISPGRGTRAPPDEAEGANDSKISRRIPRRAGIETNQEAHEMTPGGSDCVRGSPCLPTQFNPDRNGIVGAWFARGSNPFGPNHFRDFTRNSVPEISPVILPSTMVMILSAI